MNESIWFRKSDPALQVELKFHCFHFLLESKLVLRDYPESFPDLIVITDAVGARLVVDTLAKVPSVVTGETGAVLR